MPLARLILDRRTEAVGKSFLGFDAKVIFSRHPDHLPGWWLNPGSEDDLTQPRGFIQITPDLLTLGKNSIDLVAKPKPPFIEYQSGHGTTIISNRYHFRARIVEHLLALRLAGIDEMVITIPGGRVPYDGAASLFWNAVKPHLRAEGTLQWHRLPNIDISDSRRDAHLSTRPYGKEPRLTFHIDIDYGGGFAGSLELPWSLAAFEQVVGARTFGYPAGRQVLGKLAHWCGWPHYDHILWPRWRPSDEELQAEIMTVLQHRVLDLSGEFGAGLPAGSLFGGHVRSIRSGHAEGVRLVRRLHREWYAYNRSYRAAA